MIKHYRCEICKHFNDNKIDCNSPCYNCVNAHKRKVLEDKFEPMTNVDKLRRMNDKELAEWLTKITDDVQIDAKTHYNYIRKDFLKK